MRVHALRVLVLGLCLGWVCWAQATENPLTLRELQDIQRRIESAVSKSIPAVVAISDGEGFGSGVVVNADGLILTAGHVVNASRSDLEIFFPSGVTTAARLVGYNLDIDAAILQITEKGPWPHVPIARDCQLAKGDWVICLGHSGGYEVGRKPPVRTGRLLEYRNHLLVTDAALIGGDSGGPLLNLDAEVIGIHSSIGDMLCENRHVQISEFRRYWDRMVRGERWGKLIEFKEPTPTPPSNVRCGVHLELRGNQVYVASVDAQSPAARVGIRPGDRVRRIDGQEISDSLGLHAILNNKRPGNHVVFDVERHGRLLSMRVTLE